MNNTKLEDVNNEKGTFENDIDDIAIEIKEEDDIIKNNPNSISEKYDKIYKESIDPLKRFDFYSNLAKKVSWYKIPEVVLDSSNIPFYKWFPDGKINACYNCIDRHIENGLGNNKAIIGYSCYTKKTITLSYNELRDQVSYTASILIKYNVLKGDTVIIYMPMIIESIVAVLACARIGAIHSVVFGGFAAEELAERIIDAKPKLIFTASCGIEPRKRILYYPIIEEALEIAYNKLLLKSNTKDSQLNDLLLKNSYNVNDITIIIHQRENVEIQTKFNYKYKNLIYKEELEKAIKDNLITDCVSLNSNHPLYILYTSGTTGTPKGVVRDTGGHMVMLNYQMDIAMDINAGDVYFSSSDIGWVVGHNFIIYGPLLRGATTIVFEGKPVGTPDCGKLWEIIENHNVKVLYTAPTAVRAIRREDPNHETIKKYNLSSLKSIHLAGERCDPESIVWLQKGTLNKVLINDNYWQTETGYAICSNNINIHTFPTHTGSTTKPMIGQNLIIYDLDRKKEINESYKLGLVYIKLPAAPSFMLSLWNNDLFFKDKYISRDNEYYITGDAGYFDKNGYFHIMTRLDDIINVAGHRLSTGRIEEVLLKVDGVSEAAVVSINDDLKKEIPFAFIALNKSIKASIIEDTNTNYIKDNNTIESYIRINDDIKKLIVKKCKDKVVFSIGAIARLKDCVIVEKLPKTRSGKILRATLKKILNKEKYNIPSTIDDSSCLKDIELTISNLIN